MKHKKSIKQKPVQISTVVHIEVYWGLWKYNDKTDSYTLTEWDKDKKLIMKKKKFMDKVARVAK